MLCKVLLSSYFIIYDCSDLQSMGKPTALTSNNLAPAQHLLYEEMLPLLMK